MQTVRGGWLQGPTGTAMIPGSCADSSATLLNVSEVILICESHHMHVMYSEVPWSQVYSLLTTSPAPIYPVFLSFSHQRGRRQRTKN